MVSRIKDTESGAAVSQRGGGNGSRALGDVNSHGRSEKPPQSRVAARGPPNLHNRVRGTANLSPIESHCGGVTHLPHVIMCARTRRTVTRAAALCRCARGVHDFSYLHSTLRSISLLYCLTLIHVLSNVGRTTMTKLSTHACPRATTTPPRP